MAIARRSLSTSLEFAAAEQSVMSIGDPARRRSKLAGRTVTVLHLGSKGPLHEISQELDLA